MSGTPAADLRLRAVELQAAILAGDNGALASMPDRASELRDALLKIDPSGGVTIAEPLQGSAAAATAEFLRGRTPNVDRTAALEFLAAVVRWCDARTADPESPILSPDAATVAVDLSRKQATYDGTTHDVASVQALRWLKVLTDRPGEWISSTALAAHDPELDGTRTNKLRNMLPPAIDERIESKTGAGSRWRA